MSQPRIAGKFASKAALAAQAAHNGAGAAIAVADALDEDLSIADEPALDDDHDDAAGDAADDAAGLLEDAASIEEAAGQRASAAAPRDSALRPAKRRSGSRKRKRRRDAGQSRGKYHTRANAGVTDDQAAAAAAVASERAADELDDDADPRDAQIAQLRAELESEELKAAARTDADLASACGEIVNFIFDGVASARGEHWRLTAPARERLGEKLGRLVARYIPAVAKYSIEADVAITLAGEIRPRIQVDMGSMTAEDLARVNAERDRAGGSLFSRVAEATSTA